MPHSLSSHQTPNPGATAVQMNATNAKGPLIGLTEENANMVNNLQKQTSSVLQLGKRNEEVFYYLSEEARYYDAMLYQHSTIMCKEDISWESLRLRQGNILMEARKQIDRVDFEMGEQRKIISRLTQCHKETLSLFEQYTVKTAIKLEEQKKTIADLSHQKEQLASDLEEMTRIELLREKRQEKMNRNLQCCRHDAL
ncbi:hypothetical protein N7535_000724 [Penicillium sp. DV-2018c]|nr:hypothetical protein N7461_006024 [Penicillium sp. DV-2018c]KAJ5582104.1 hypothetical protein N7535_000724 [Penicillium sp. DV-2018c]